jgi:hypothetical protein
VSHVVIEGVKVSFRSRDIRLANDREMEQIRGIVLAELPGPGFNFYLGGDQVLESIEIQTDYLGPGMRYHTTTTVHTTGVEKG